MDKKMVVQVLEEIGLLLELKGENPFKTRAYENGARIIEMLDEDLETLVREGKLADIKGIGKALEQKIEELVTTGKLEYYENLKQSFPSTLFDLMKVPGLGPKKVKVLYHELGVSTLGELEYACLENRLLDLPGFGKKTQENILNGLEHLKQYLGRSLFSDAWATAHGLLEKMKQCSEVLESSVAGSLRRKKELIKDVDLLVSSKQPGSVMEYFTQLPGIEDIIAKGDTKSSIRMQSGIAVDLRVVAPDEYPYALHHFTGSKEHNTAMRHLAKEKGIKMNEYGLFKVDTEERIECSNEEEIFRTLGMAYIPPELREDRGEIQAALQKALPTLVTDRDIKGFFHVHSHYSDGRNSLQELVEQARKMNYQYIGMADHSQSAFYAHGLKPEDIKRQLEEIDEINSKYSDFVIFKGIESDILVDGSLDYPQEVLTQFDYVIGSVHSNFGMSREDMTQRLIRAMENPYMTMLGHPTGRLLLAREEYPLDLEQVIEKAAERHIIIEINANPHRLDLDWRWVKRAREAGVKIAINPDAHDIHGFEDIKYGVGIARKGWLEKKDVINCLDPGEVAGKFEKKE